MKTKFDSGHAVIPVHVGNGQVDHIAFPIDTPIPELHSVLLDHVQSKQPNREDVLENQPSFRATPVRQPGVRLHLAWSQKRQDST